MILESCPEQAYTDIVRLLADGLEVPIALVNLLDADRDWFKACVGSGVNQSPSETSFCETFFHSTNDVIVVEDTIEDERFVDHPLVAGEPHIRFYAAARLAVRGHTVGTLCAYDVRPHRVTRTQLESLRQLAAAAIELLLHRPQAI